MNKENQIAESLRHELQNYVTPLRGAVELAKNEAPVPEGSGAVKREEDVCRNTEIFVNSVELYLDDLKEGRSPSNDKLEQIINSGSNIEGKFDESLQWKVRDTVNLIQAADEYLNPHKGSEVEVGEVLDQFERFGDSYNINYVGGTGPETELDGNRGLKIPFHTLVLNEETYWWNLSGTDYSWDSVEADPDLKIDVERSSDEVEIYMGDNGPGLPDEIKDDPEIIFDEEFSTSGGGYGLPMAERMIEEYGGDIEYSEDAALESAFSENDYGFGLEIKLPAAQ